MSILVAEDDPQISKLVVRLLACAGFEVVVAADGDAAASLIESARFAAVLIDLSLAPHGARHTLAVLRAQRPELGVLVISGTPPDAEMVGYLKQVGGEFLPKPFAPSGLLSALEAVLARGRA